MKKEKMRFEICTLDVLGCDCCDCEFAEDGERVYDKDECGSCEGFTVNDMYSTGDYIELTEHQFYNQDGVIIKKLIEVEYLKDSVTKKDVEIDGDEFLLYVDNKKTSKPVFQLRRDPEQVIIKTKIEVDTK